MCLSEVEVQACNRMESGFPRGSGVRTGGHPTIAGLLQFVPPYPTPDVGIKTPDRIGVLESYNDSPCL